jgi:hypothetical protein
MTETVRTIEGWFWFPPDEQRAFGTLELEPRALRLRLRDSPRPDEPSDESVVVHGESLDGDALTMLGATISGRTGVANYGHNVERYRGHTVLIGAHLLGEEELVVERVTVRLRGMTEWMRDVSRGRSPYAGARVIDPERDELPDPLEVSLEGARLKLGLGVKKNFREHEQSLSFYANAAFEFEPAISLTDWRERWSRPLLDFFVFATREQIVTEELTVSNYDDARLDAVHPAIRRASTDQYWATERVEVIRQQEVDVRPRSIEPFRHQLLPLGALGDRAPVVIARFFELHRELGSAALVLFAVLNTRTIFEENRLLNLMAFVEGYHRRLFDEPHLTDQEHEELVSALLDAIPKKHKNLYGPALKRAHQQTQRQRLKWLIARAAGLSRPLWNFDGGPGVMVRQR